MQIINNLAASSLWHQLAVLNYHPPAKPSEKTSEPETTDLTKQSYTCQYMREGKGWCSREKDLILQAALVLSHWFGRSWLSTGKEGYGFRAGPPACLDLTWQAKTSQGSMTSTAWVWHLLVFVWLSSPVSSICIHVTWIFTFLFAKLRAVHKPKSILCAGYTPILPGWFEWRGKWRISDDVHIMWLYLIL